MPTQHKFRPNDHDVVHTYIVTNVTDANAVIADRPYQLIGVKAAYGAAAGAALTVDVKKCTGTTAPASGTTMLGATLDLNSSINTVMTATLSSTVANTKVATGDRIAFDFSSTIGSLAGCVLVLILRPLDVK